MDDKELSMNKQIHFYEDNQRMSIDSLYMTLHKDRVICRDRSSTVNALVNNVECILTTDMTSLSSSLFSQNYRIFINQVGYKNIEVKIGSNDWTQKDVRESCDLFKMYMSGMIRCHK